MVEESGRWQGECQVAGRVRWWSECQAVESVSGGRGESQVVEASVRWERECQVVKRE